jgi:hypothetical protein
MVILWSFGTTFVSHLYGEIDPKILGFLLAMAMLPSMFQHNVIKLKIPTLLGLLVILDATFSVTNLFLIYINKLNILAVFDIVLGGLYQLMLSVINIKISNNFLHNAKKHQQDGIRSKVESLRMRSRFIGLSLGSIVAGLGLSLYNALLLQNILILLIAVPLSMYLYKQSLIV